MEHIRKRLRSVYLSHQSPFSGLKAQKLVFQAQAPHEDRGRMISQARSLDLQWSRYEKPVWVRFPENIKSCLFIPESKLNFPNFVIHSCAQDPKVNWVLN